MSKRIVFTKKVIEGIESPKKGRLEVRDAKVPGLSLRITSKGSKTFSVYKKIGGRPERVTIGPFPDVTVEQARRRAGEILAAIFAGANPAEAKRAGRDAPTLQSLFDYWLEHAKLRKKTWPADVKLFENHFGPLRDRRLEDITDPVCVAWHSKIGRDVGPFQANRCRSLLSTLYADAHRLGFEGPSPTRRVKRFRERSRDRYLLPEEAPALFRSLEEEKPAIRDFFHLALLTGARKANLLAMRWDELRLDGTWRITESKNGEPITIPLVQQAQKILHARREAVGESEWVFPGTGKAGHLSDCFEAWDRVRTRAGLEDLHIHDLRRTLGSWQAVRGVSETIIGKSLGHKPGSRATAVYARLGLDPVREAMSNATDALWAAAKGGGDDDKS